MAAKKKSTKGKAPAKPAAKAKAAPKAKATKAPKGNKDIPTTSSASLVGAWENSGQE